MKVDWNACKRELRGQCNEIYYKKVKNSFENFQVPFGEIYGKHIQKDSIYFYGLIR